MQGMARLHVPAIVVFALATAGVSPVGGQSVGPSAPEKGREAALLDLSGVRRLVAPLSRLRANQSDEEKAAAWAVGYSARETADIVRAAGLGREHAANYLDREYRRAAMRRERPRQPSDELAAGPLRFDPFIEKYGVDATIVRAIIEAELGYPAAAVTRAGAIDLMQLMPATARELRVNPHVPEQNVEGGVRYFASLLRIFGRIDLALVAYNGGPGYAQRYASGHAVLYGETRAYVRAVLGKLRPQALMQ
jgi:soluble lytic murein transglycosylase-like protein